MQVLGFVAFSSLCLTTGAFAPPSVSVRQNTALFSTVEETEQAIKTTDWVAEQFERLSPSDVFGSVSSTSTISYLDSLPSHVHHKMQGQYHQPNMMYNMPAAEDTVPTNPLPVMYGKNMALAELENQFDTQQHTEIQMEVESTPQSVFHATQGSPPGKNMKLGELQNQFDKLDHTEIQMEVDSTPLHVLHATQGDYHKPNMMYSMPATEETYTITKSPPPFQGKNMELGELQNQFNKLEHVEIQMEVDSTPQYVRHDTQGDYHQPNMMYNMPATEETYTITKSPPPFQGKNMELGELQNQFNELEHAEIQMQIEATPQYFLHPTQGDYHQPNMMYNAPATEDTYTITKSPPPFQGKNMELGELQNQFDSLDHTEIQMTF